MLKDLESSASALYDGGWRAEDKDELKTEYDMTEQEAEAICEKLAEYAEKLEHIEDGLREV